MDSNATTTVGIDCNESYSNVLLNNVLNDTIISHNSSNGSHDLNDEKDLELLERTPEPTNRNITEAPRTIIIII